MAEILPDCERQLLFKQRGILINQLKRYPCNCVGITALYLCCYNFCSAVALPFCILKHCCRHQAFLYGMTSIQRCINADIRYILFVIDTYGGSHYLLNEMEIRR